MRIASLATRVLGISAASLMLTAASPADNGPSIAETVGYLSSYLAADEDHLIVEGQFMVFDRNPKCAYDSKIPLNLVRPKILISSAAKDAITVSIACAEGECIRRFSTCDHRINQRTAEVKFTFRASKKTSVEKAFKHLFEKVSETKGDPFS